MTAGAGGLIRPVLASAHRHQLRAALSVSASVFPLLYASAPREVILRQHWLPAWAAGRSVVPHLPFSSSPGSQLSTRRPSQQPKAFQENIEGQWPHVYDRAAKQDGDSRISRDRTEEASSSKQDWQRSPTSTSRAPQPRAKNLFGGHRKQRSGRSWQQGRTDRQPRSGSWQQHNTADNSSQGEWSSQCCSCEDTG